MQRTVIAALNATQQRVVPPIGTRKLDHIQVNNPAATVVFLNFWVDTALTGAPALNISAIVDQVAVPVGAAEPVLMDLPIFSGTSGTLVISASTAVNGTGAPSSDLQVSLRWGPVS